MRSYSVMFIRNFVPLFLAFFLCSIILFYLNTNPLVYYEYIIKRCLTNSLGFEAVLLKMIPILCISAGLMIAFKSGIWNLGGDGQFLLGAVFSIALATKLAGFMPPLFFIPLCLVLSLIVGALWIGTPAFLYIKYGINEVVSTLMMSFIGISLANLLIKGPLRDVAFPHPQTLTLAVENRLLRLFDSNVHWGFFIAVMSVISAHYILNHTALGIKWRIIGTNKKAAHHLGYAVNYLLFISFCLSGAFIGLAGAIEVLGVYGTVQANWNPAYSILAIPIVFLGRCHAGFIIIYTFLFAILLVGGESASRVMQVPNYIIHVLLALVMLFSAIVHKIYDNS